MARQTSEVLHRIGITAADGQLMIVRDLEGSLRTLQQWRRSAFTVSSRDEERRQPEKVNHLVD